MAPAASESSSVMSQDEVQEHQPPSLPEHGSPGWDPPGWDPPSWDPDPIEDSEHLPPFHLLTKISDHDWASFAALKPSKSEMRQAIKMGLRRYWYEHKEMMFASNMERAWNSTWGYMSTLYSGDVSKDIIGTNQIRLFGNKPTGLYWATSAQLDGYCPRLIFGCIYKEWFRSAATIKRQDWTSNISLRTQFALSRRGLLR